MVKETILVVFAMTSLNFDVQNKRSHILNMSGGDSDSSLCQLGFCTDTWMWLGMGWCNLALQCGDVYSS